MNENIDLTKILKDCPAGTKLYSTIFGDVKFSHIFNDSIVLHTYNGGVTFATKHGKHNIDYEMEGECVLFPSKEQRDWSKFTAPWYKKERFDPNTLQPFDRVLFKTSSYIWNCSIVSHVENSRIYLITGGYVYNCIPYNDDTKHLVGTTDEAPEFYRYWED